MSLLGRPIDPADSITRLKTRSEAGDQATGSPEPHPRGAPTPTTFASRTPVHRLSGVILSQAARARIDVLLSRIANHALIYTEWGLADVDPSGRQVAFNLYGPPGTGKTMCVDAIAAELGRPIIDVSYAEIESKYVGETGKNIVAAFESARREKAVLFFDEADSILGKRMTSVTQAADHGVNVARAVMLKQLDSCDGIVAFATNLARNFDGAFVRRIMMHVELPLPDRAARAALWQKLVPPRVPGRCGLDWDQLADESDGLSGGDIRNAVVAGLSTAAARAPASRRITVADLVSATKHVLQAKHDIGQTAPMPQSSEFSCLDQGANDGAKGNDDGAGRSDR